MDTERKETGKSVSRQLKPRFQGGFVLACDDMALHYPQAETPTDFITMGIHED